MDEGKKKLVIKFFGYLISEFNMQFTFQKFDKYEYFYGPIYCYSFYNEFGCLTFHNVAQRGEWGVFVSKKFSTNQYELLEQEINQTEYLNKSYYLTKSWIKDLSKVVYAMAKKEHKVFSIKL